MNDDELRSAFDGLLTDLPADPVLPAATAGRVRRRRQLKVGAGALGGVGVLVTAAVLVLGGTSPADERLVPAEQPTSSSTPTPSPTPSRSVSPSPAASSAPTSSSGTSSAPAAPTGEGTGDVRVVLRPDGLGVTDGGSSTSALAFGTDAATVRAALDGALGRGGARETPDCGAASVTVQYETLFVLLDDDVFVGWVTGTPGPTTGDGVGVGSTLADLRASYPDLQVTESTIGPEWTTAGDGGLSGTLDGTEETSIVNSVRGGVACIAR